MMRIVMMGTGGFAVPTFQALLASDHEVVALVTRPMQRGRGGRPPKNPMREAGEQAQLRMEDPPSINDPDAIEMVASLSADLMVVCDYGQILSRAALAATPLGGINLHASLLPAYRGAAPINWAIYDGQTETGVSVIHMTPKLDGGPVLLQRRTTIGPRETAIDVERRLAEIGASAVLDAVQMIDAWDRESGLGQVQMHGEATKAPRLKKEDGRVVWARSAKQIADQVRAFQPWPRAYTSFTHGKKCLRLILHETTVREGPTAEPGTVMASPDKSLLVATGGGHLQLDVVQPEGKKQLSGAEFLRGYQVQPGTQLGG